MVWSTYLQGSKGDADKENRLLETVREGEGGMLGVSSTETHTVPYVKSPVGFAMWCRLSKTDALCRPRGVGWGEGGRESQEGGNTSVAMADLCWCMAETSTILYRNCPPIKIKLKKREVCRCRGHSLDLWYWKVPRATEARSPRASVPDAHAIQGPCSAVREAGAAGSLHTQLGATPAAR